MPRFFIRTTNSVYHARDEGGEYDLPAIALSLGVKGAIAILADEVICGKNCAAVEVSIEKEDGSQVLRSVIALSVSSLITPDPLEAVIA